jgi:hypothetical protein
LDQPPGTKTITFLGVLQFVPVTNLNCVVYVL